MKTLAEYRAAASSHGIDAALVEERFSRSSGPGGQNVNKVSTAVSVHYPPLDLTVVCEDSRSQSMNRLLAWERLLEKATALRTAAAARRKAEREKIRRRNRPRPRGLKERILKSKKKRSELKKLRSGGL